MQNKIAKYGIESYPAPELKVKNPREDIFAAQEKSRAKDVISNIPK